MREPVPESLCQIINVAEYLPPIAFDASHTIVTGLSGHFRKSPTLDLQSNVDACAEKLGDIKKHFFADPLFLRLDLDAVLSDSPANRGESDYRVLSIALAAVEAVSLEG